jgi:hypothetical protein
MYLMRTVVIATTLLSLGGPPELAAPSGEPLRGITGSSPKWESGWIDLATTIDLKPGDKLQLLIGGRAQQLVVRLLSKGQHGDESDGVVAIAHVPANRIVEVALSQHYRQVVHISVHGGEFPWKKYELGSGNGAATLESAAVIRGRKAS